MKRRTLGFASLLVPAGALGTLSAVDPLYAAVGAVGAALVVPVVAGLLMRRSLHPLDPLWPFLACYAITFVLAPVLVSVGVRTYQWPLGDVGEHTVPVLLALAALLFLYAGYSSRLFVTPLRVLPACRREPSLRRARWAALALALGGVVGQLIILQLMTSEFRFADALVEKYRTEALRLFFGRGYLTILFSLAVFAPAIQAYVAARSRRLADAALTLAILGAVMPAFVMLYSRDLILRTAVTLVVVLHYRAGWFGRRTLIGLGAGMGVLGGLLGTVTRRGTASPLTAIGFLAHTFDSYEFFPLALRQFSTVGHSFGVSLAEDFVWTFVPRALLADKPEAFGIVVVQRLVAPDVTTEVTRATFPPGFLPEWYVNFGLLGVVLVGLLYGVGLRVAREWLHQAPGTLFRLLVHGGIVLGGLTTLFRSSAQFGIQALVIGALLFLVLYGRIPVFPGRRPEQAGPEWATKPGPA